MDSLSFKIIIAFCGGSFLVYAITCLTTQRMRREFDRYGLARFRTLTGALQLLGVGGLAAGLNFPWIGCLAAAGFVMQMFLAVIVRRTIGDNLKQCLPALLYLFLNAWLMVCFYRAV